MKTIVRNLTSEGWSDVELTLFLSGKRCIKGVAKEDGGQGSRAEGPALMHTGALLSGCQPVPPTPVIKDTHLQASLFFSLLLHCLTSFFEQFSLYHSGSPLSCPALCDPMDYTVHGILQARILEWVAFPFSRGPSQPRGQTGVSSIAGRFLTNWAIREALHCGKHGAKNHNHLHG